MKVVSTASRHRFECRRCFRKYDRSSAGISFCAETGKRMDPRDFKQPKTKNPSCEEHPRETNQHAATGWLSSGQCRNFSRASSCTRAGDEVGEAATPGRRQPRRWQSAATPRVQNQANPGADTGIKSETRVDDRNGSAHGTFSRPRALGGNAPPTSSFPGGSSLPGGHVRRLKGGI